MAVQNIDDLLSQLLTTSQQLAVNPPQMTLPPLNVTLPSAGDLSGKYQEFLTRAANDPDIVNYYKQLLDQAKGDTTIAQNFLENDYTTGVRNTMDNLKGTLQQMGLTFEGEQNSLENTLNQRGIALTQDPNSSHLTYAGAGEAGHEQSNLNESQQLRQEAEQRSASQSITGAGNTLQKGLTSTGQSLTQTAQNLNQQEQSDIGSRANTYYGLYQQDQANQQNKATQAQSFATQTGLGQLATGDPKNMTQSQRQALFTSYGHTGVAPVGYGGG